jgi:HprK-related kinase A
LKLSDLTSDELQYRLTSGLILNTGAFNFRLQTSIPSVIEGVKLLYADYTQRHEEFADFHVTIASAKGLRRWIKPQALFHFDGFSPFKPLPLNQAFPLLEWGMNWCVSNHAHSYLMIHAAVVEKNGRAVILPAPPGSGKSTLCALLVCRGWRLLSDELTLVRLSDGQITPLPRPVSLKNQSIDVIKTFEPQVVFSRSVLDTIKGTVAHMKAPAESIHRSLETAKASWIIFPKFQTGATTLLKSIPQARALMRVADNAFNYSLLGARGFHAMANLINATRSYEFTYSEIDEAMATFDALQNSEDDE